jgi:chlorophyll synthase
MGIRSLPVSLGPGRAAKVASAAMAVPQLAVIALLLDWGRPLHAAVVAGLLLVQLLMMRRFVADPARRALWLSGLGVPLYVLGMLAAALALRGIEGGA